MAGYGYPNRGYNTYNANEAPPRSEGWSKTSYAGDGSSDHVCGPVIVDAEGRKHPIISYSTPNHNTESYVAKTETIVEHVQIPMVTEYRYKAESSPEYGYSNNKWGTPSNTSIYDRPPKVGEFLAEVQTEVGRPNRPSGAPLGYWRQSPTSPGYNGGTTGSGYNDYDVYGNKLTGNTIRSDNFSGYNRRDDPPIEPVATSGGWASRPKHVTWGALPPPSYETPLSKPTSEIGAAVEILKEVAFNSKPPLGSMAAAAALPQPRFRVAVPRREGGYGDTIDSRPKKESYTESIDSREARRYGNFNGSSNRPMGDPYDSREATRKY